MKNEILQVKENEAVTTSLIVAETFKKNHKDVLRKIDMLISEIETGAILRPFKLFEKTEQKDAHNQMRPMYYINRDGFTLLAMSFTGKEALEWKLKYIEAFNEMERKLKTPGLTDNRLEIARLILSAPESKLFPILELYPEYFSNPVHRGSLEYVSDVNTSYTKWIEDYNITPEWIGAFPTIEIYNSYMRYCVENRLPSMGKKYFYKVLETDFNFIRRQKGNGYRYFISA